MALCDKEFLLKVFDRLRKDVKRSLRHYWQRTKDFYVKATDREAGQDTNTARNKTEENKHEKNKQDIISETWYTNKHWSRTKGDNKNFRKFSGFQLRWWFYSMK